MNSKKNSFKRVAAGALAVLTVAAYTAPVANVGGLPSVNVLSADAAVVTNQIDWSNAKQYLTKFAQDAEGTENDVNYTSGLTGFKTYDAVAGANITIESKVPLDINYHTAKAGVAIAGYAYQDTANVYYDNTLALNTVKYSKDTTEYELIVKAPEANTSLIYSTLAGKDIADGSREMVDNSGNIVTNIASAKYVYNKEGGLTVWEIADYANARTKGTVSHTKKYVAFDAAKWSTVADEADVKKSALTKAVLGDAQMDDDVYDAIIAAATLNTTTDPVQAVQNLVVNEKASTDKFTYTFVMPAEQVDVKTTKQTATYAVYDKEEDRKIGTTAGTLSTKPIENLTITDNTLASAASLTGESGGVGDLVIGDTITVEATEPFAVHVNDNNDKNAWTNPVTSFAKGKFTATFKMPKSANATAVEIQVVRVAEEYSYTVGSGKLFASTKSGSIKDAEAASLTVKSYATTPTAETIDIAAAEPKNGTDVAANGKVANGRKVAVYPQFAAKLTSETKLPTFKVTKDDVTVVDPTKTKAAAVVEGDTNGVAYVDAGYYTFTKAGSYTVTYTITGIDTKSYDVTYTFVIAAKDELVAEDFNFTLSTKQDGRDQTALETATIIKGGTVADLTQTGVTGKPVSFMLAKNEAENVKKSNYQFTITPEIKGGKLDATDYDVIGYPSGSKLDNKYTFTIRIYNSEYGGSKKNPKTIDVEWIIKDYIQDPIFQDVNRSIAKENTADAEDIKDFIFNEAATNETAKALRDDADFEYVVGVGALRTGEVEDELDEFIQGVPSEIGTYTVYIKVDNEVVSTVNLQITAYGVSIVGTQASDFELTYSDLFNLSKYKLVDKDGKTVTSVKVSDIKATIKTKAVLDKDGNVTTPSTVISAYDANDLAKPVFVDGLTLEQLKEVYIPAGEYIITFSGTSSDPSKYAVSTYFQDLTVAKKKLSDKTFKVVVEPFAYDGETHDVVKNGTFRAYDAVTGEDMSKKVKVTEGGKQSEIGTYEASVMLVSDNTDYEGTGKFNWAITYKENNKIQAGLEWDNTRTTLYNNGYIHTEFKRNANDKITLNGKTQKIKQFGVVYENEGLLKAPSTEYGKAFDATELANAEKYLQLGNAKAGKYDNVSTKVKADSTQIYSNQIAVKNVETGVWVRPYLQVESGEVVYGEVKYLDLSQEAIQKLKLQMPIEAGVSTGKTAGVRKADLDAKLAKDPLKNVKSGYIPEKDRFYAYAQFVDLETAGFSDVLQVSDFGVILDNKGIIASNANAAEVSKQLKIGKNKNYVVGHYDPANKVLKTNEYAATIKAKNSATGVWVRPYLDLGNGLVIYGDAKYIASASAYYTTAANGTALAGAGTLSAAWTDDTKTKLEFDVTKANDAKDLVKTKTRLDDNSKVKVLETGVVLDKKGLIAAEDDVNTKLILNAGFIQGSKDKDFDMKYTGKSTPVAGKDMYVRSYVTYDINGNAVTVYGNTTRYIYDKNKSCVVNYDAANDAPGADILVK